MRINCNELSYKMRREITSDKESVWYGTRDIRWAKARPGGLPNPARDDRTWDPNRKRFPNVRKPDGDASSQTAPGARHKKGNVRG